MAALTGTLLDRIRRPDELLTVLDDMQSLVPSSCRRLAARLGLDHMTVWNWRRRVARALATTAIPPGHDAIAALTLRRSRKA